MGKDCLVAVPLCCCVYASNTFGREDMRIDSFGVFVSVLSMSGMSNDGRAGGVNDRVCGCVGCGVL